MRIQSIYHLLKHDIYDVRWILLSCLLIPFILFLTILWKENLFVALLNRPDALSRGVEIIILGIFLLSFLTVWVMVVARLGTEERHGFYMYLRTAPMTAEEIVTAKFLMSFIVINGSLLWLNLLLLGIAQVLPPLDQPHLWLYIYVYGLLLTVWLTVQHALFFRRGARESATIYFILGFIFIIWLRSFERGWIEKFGNIFVQNIPFLTGLGIILLLVTWFICWRWALRSYRRYYDAGSKGVYVR